MLEVGGWQKNRSLLRWLRNLESQLLGGLSFGQALSQGHKVTLSYSPGNSLSESIRNNSGRHNGIGGLHCEGQRTRARNLLHNNQTIRIVMLHNNHIQTLHLTRWDTDQSVNTFSTQFRTEVSSMLAPFTVYCFPKHRHHPI